MFLRSRRFVQWVLALFKGRKIYRLILRHLKKAKTYRPKRRERKKHRFSTTTLRKTYEGSVQDPVEIAITN